MRDCSDVVLGISETWLEDINPTHNIDIAGYNFERLDRTWVKPDGDDKGGGVGIYIRNDFSYSVDNYKHLNVSSNDIEMMWTEIVRNGKKNVVVINLYRPPDGNKALFIEAFNSKLSVAKLRRKDVIIMGDFNFDYLNQTKVSTKLMKICINLQGMRQIIDVPTRSTEESETCIDWVITNTMKKNCSVVRNWNISDHVLVGITLMDQYFVHERIQFEGRTYRKYDAEIFKVCIQNADWGPYDDCANVTQRWDFILKLLSKELDKMCPMKVFKVNKARSPWVSDHILELIHDKDLALTKAKKSKSPGDWEIAKRLRNSTNKSIRKAKSKFIRDALEENKKDSKKFWKIINGILRGEKTNVNFNLRDKINDTPVECGDTPDFINDYFINIGPKLAQGYDEVWSYDGETVPMSIGDIVTNEVEVIKLIKEIDIGKSSSIDGISARALKDCLSSIPDKIVTLFNCSLVEVGVPQPWKLGTVIPLQKEGDKTDVANLRPVTLLPVIGKLLEKIVNNRLMNYLETNELLDKNQGGFRSGHSTIDTVAYFTDSIYKGLNNREYTLSTLIDLKKAFDTVNHSILINKLEKLGVGGNLLKWIQDYLTNRKQRTFANGSTSREGDVLCGVPQGSILGPTLFLVYINDLKNVLKTCDSYLYADDTVVTLTGSDIAQLTMSMEEDLSLLNAWFRKNKLTLNTKKTNYIIFGMRSRLKEIPNHRLLLAGTPIERCLSVKYLGIVLDQVLNFNMQAEVAFKKLVYKSYLTARLRDILDNVTMINIFKTMVLPHADYGDILYDVANKNTLDKLQIIQNKSLRKCLGLDHLYPTIATHQEARISKLQPRRQMHLCNFMFKQKNNMSIVNTREIYTRAHDALLFTTVKPKNQTCKKSVLYRGAMLWNSLSIEVRSIEDFETFKLNRKKWLGSTNYNFEFW